MPLREPLPKKPALHRQSFWLPEEGKELENWGHAFDISPAHHELAAQGRQAVAPVPGK